MKSRIIFTLLLLIIVIPVLKSQNVTPVRVTFILRSEALPEDTSVFITGSTEELGMWNPGKVKMESINNHTWKKEITIGYQQTVEFKYTLGSWSNEGVDKAGSPLPNFSVRISKDTIITQVISFWKNGETARVMKGQVTGNIKYHHKVKGEGIPARDLVVWLPPDYDSDLKKRYPVLYMEDGQNIFDPATSSFGVEWRIDETSDSLIREKVIKGVIIVGIYNTGDRMKEYIPGEKCTAYMNYVIKNVKHLIDSAYRTLPDRKHTFTGGSSAGATISFMLVWEHPEVFSKAICMSPAFRVPKSLAELDYVKSVRESGKKKKNVFFYIDNGGVGLDSDLQPGIDEMIKSLQDKGYRKEKDFVFLFDARARHFEADWAKRFPKALISIMKNK